MSRPRKIIHIDMDAFYAAVEQRDYPELKGLPIAIGGKPETRGVIATASYEARQFGVRSAMSSFKAVKLCPQLILRPGRFSAYKEVSSQIRNIFSDYTDLIEPLSLDEAYLDVTENKKNLPSATLLAYEIKQRILEDTGLTASAGVSYNKFLAKVASDFNKPNGLCVIPPHQAEQFVEKLPIGRFYGIGAKTEPKLQALGIQTGADLKALSPEALERIFGRSAAFYYQLARGQDHRPVETEWIRKSVGSENTFIEDLSDRTEMLSELRPLAEEVLGWMQRHELFGRTLTLKVKYADFQQITRSRTLTKPLKTLEPIMQTLSQLLAMTEAGSRKVRLLGLSISKLAEEEASTNITSEGHQLTLAL